MRILSSFVLSLALLSTLPAQPPGGGAEERERLLVDEFDQDNDGVLNEQERAQARQFVKDNPRQRGPGGPGGRGRGGPGGFGGRGPGGPGGPGGFGGRGPGGPGGGNTEPNQPGPSVSPEDVEKVEAPLYDESVLRTWFLDFDTDDWEDELADFYRTDVLVPARLTVDGKTYDPVGIGFRGNSSFFTVSKGQKRSFNITMDYGGKTQDLYGYRTLNLLNAHTDPSFLRETLYNHVARNYTAAPQSNFVRLVVNGESWGVYVNAQQVNKDFTQQWFDSRDGVRWKISPGPGSDGSTLTYNGPEKSAYAGFQLKSKSSEKAWSDLIELCRVLNETPVEELHEKLESVMSIDSALWFLALDNTLIDTDGYYSRGSDYMLYQHPEDGRFHVLTYDSNETFRSPGGGGPPGGGRGGFGGRGGPGGFGPGGPGGFGPGGPGGFGPGGPGERGFGGPPQGERPRGQRPELERPEAEQQEGTPDQGPRPGGAGGPERRGQAGGRGPGADGGRGPGADGGRGPGADGGRGPGADGGRGPGADGGRGDGGPGPGGRGAGGPGPGGRGAGGPGGGGTPNLELDPFEGEDNERLVLISRLLKNPVIRARYAAHVRTITHDWLEWQKTKPVIDSYHHLIHDEVKADTRKLDSFENFVSNLTDDIASGRRSTPGLKRFVEQRGEFLRNHPEVSRPHPMISDVSHHTTDSGPVITATITGEIQPENVFVYHSEERYLRFDSVEMFDDGQHHDGDADDGVFGAKLPVAGRIYYYVEARTTGDQPTTAFYPSSTERGAIEFVSDLRSATNSPVIINEVMASNTATLKDPQGDFDDWIELFNTSNASVDLSGMYLTDSESNPQKWMFPKGTVIDAGEYLIVWADDDKAKEGLHANFKLSKYGESLFLVDADGISALDAIHFGSMEDDVAYGRPGDGGEPQTLQPTPAAANETK